MVALGLLMALESVPRLADAAAGLVFVLSTVALLPLATSLILQVRPDCRAADRSNSGDQRTAIPAAASPSLTWPMVRSP